MQACIAKDASIPLHTSICSFLWDIVNILASGKNPSSIYKIFSLGGSLAALNEQKEGCPPDIRPIAVWNFKTAHWKVFVCSGKGEGI